MWKEDILCTATWINVSHVIANIFKYKLPLIQTYNIISENKMPRDKSTWKEDKIVPGRMVTQKVIIFFF